MGALKHLALAGAVCLAGSGAAANPEFWAREWPDTDFETTTVGRWSEILSGGPPKDGIPALSAPEMIPVDQETRIMGREPVIAVELDGQVPRAYPIRYLTWHEIVNDQIGQTPIAVTFCPLCNSAMSFDRRVQGQRLSFGVTGKLRNSDMIMYDHQTQSWWQQAMGVGIVGKMTGVELVTLPTWMESWDRFRARNPDGLVMDQPKYVRQYGANPYQGYDSSGDPFLYNGENPPFGIPALARVVRVGDRAWPLERIVAAKELRESGLVISWSAGQASALDTSQMGQGHDVGNIRVRNDQGQDMAHDVTFAFAFHAFWPDGRWMLDPERD